MITNDIAPA